MSEGIRSRAAASASGAEAAARAAAEAAARAAAEASRQGKDVFVQAKAGAQAMPDLQGASTPPAVALAEAGTTVANPQSAGFFDNLKDAARRNIPGYSTAESVVQGAVDYVKGAREATDFGDVERLRRMTPGDKITIGGGFSGGFKVARLNTRQQTEVSFDKEEVTDKKTGEKTMKDVYTLSIDGEVSGGVGKKLAQGKVGLQAVAGGGGKMEFKFDSPEEVKRAKDIMDQMTRESTLMGVGLKTGPGVDPKDAEWLRSKMSAVELRGQVVADAAASLGVKLPGGINEVGGSGKLRTETALRLEYKDGKPELVFKTSAQVELQGSLGRGVGKEKSLTSPDGVVLPVAGGKVTLGGNGKVTGKVETETRVPLPTGTDIDALMKDPAGALKQQATQLKDGLKTKMTLTLDGQGTVNGNGVGVNVELSVTGKPGQLLEGGAYEKALKGDIEGMSRSTDPAAEVELKVQPYTQKGITLSPGIYVGVAEAAVEFEATSRDVIDSMRIHEKLTSEQLTKRSEEARRAAN